MQRPAFVTIVEETPSHLEDYCTVSIAFEVSSILVPEQLDGGLSGIRMVERAIPEPYVKDYDVYAGEGPRRCASRWDLSNWGILAAYDGNRRVGGAVIARRTEGVTMLEDREDLAVLWDFRIDHGYRRRGVGTELFKRAMDWARTNDCVEMIIETQNVNVPACHFYASRGCQLRTIDLHAYPDLPEETKLIWRLMLNQERSGQRSIRES